MTLKSRLGTGNILVAPGVYDGLTASIAQAAGFEALYLSGAAVAYTRLGRPDIGLTSVTEMADTMALIADRVEVPVIIDADTGFGNALNAERTLRQYERAGAAALQIEDQSYPKRCGHLKDKTLINAPEMAGKIRAMADARRSEDTLIVARTDAIAVEGFDAATDRAESYLEAGADVLFIEAPQSRAQLQAITAQFKGRVPLLANMVEGGATPMHNASDLEKLGFSVVIFPGGIVRTLARTAQDYYASLVTHGSNAPFAGRMHDFDSLNKLIGTSEMLARGKAYEG
ncbi:carboxyvinyl-carboxyphosphonate phosphorylmutase [Sulfitobacter sp. EhC04]|uniref:isocitrate lyase/PEP mutase family protein n=1 Tax=Sulfitobacter sp. EhC04 TaxID=1849168 RepID=UPI0007F4A89D|nr:isocitrate lyase/phosphoenolpyruvate mutase family protein [Sulfitobacter sp. EhC04]OAN73491.1 carboxyvinyl-carboxyphosphonate phosphorylmutase [Sulfitobacter sp. EhC04]